MVSKCLINGGGMKIRRKRANETFTQCQRKSVRIIFIGRKTELWPQSTKKGGKMCEKEKERRRPKNLKIILPSFKQISFVFLLLRVSLSLPFSIHCEAFFVKTFSE